MFLFLATFFGQKMMYQLIGHLGNVHMYFSEADYDVTEDFGQRP